MGTESAFFEDGSSPTTTPLGLFQHEHKDKPNYEQILRDIETMLRPQQGWTLKGLLPRTASALAQEHALLLSLLRSLLPILNNPPQQPGDSDDEPYSWRARWRGFKASWRRLRGNAGQVEDAADNPDAKEAAQAVWDACMAYWSTLCGAAAQTDAKQKSEAYDALKEKLDQQVEHIPELSKKYTQDLQQLQEQLPSDFKSIVRTYRRMDSGDSKINQGRRFSSGFFYNGEHHEAVQRSWFKRTWHQTLFIFTFGSSQYAREHYEQASARRIRKTFISICEQLSIIHPDLLQDLNSFFKNEQQGVAFQQALIVRLHNSFNQVARVFSSALDNKINALSKNLLQHYKPIDCPNEVESAIKILIDALLIGIDFNDGSLQTAIKTIRLYNNDSELNPSNLVLLSQLKHDCRHWHKQLQVEITENNITLKRLKKEINHLASELAVPLRISHPKKEKKRGSEAQGIAATFEYETFIFWLIAGR